MDEVIQAQVLKVRRFSRYARMLCIPVFVIFGLAVLAFCFSILTGIAGPGSKVALGAFSINPSYALPLGVKAWAVFVLALIFGLLFKGLYHVYALFGHFMRGEIYTKGSVHQLRQIGLVGLCLPLVVICTTVLSLMFLRMGWIDPALVTRETMAITPTSFSSFMWPALILLASWVMEVGRQTHEEAERMRREAELVV